MPDLSHQTRACPTCGPTCRGCPDCQGIPFDAETDAALLEEFGGPAEPIILAPDEQAEIEVVLAYVARTGHQP